MSLHDSRLLNSRFASDPVSVESRFILLELGFTSPKAGRTVSEFVDKRLNQTVHFLLVLALIGHGIMNAILLKLRAGVIPETFRILF